MRLSIRPLGLACFYLALGCPSNEELKPEDTNTDTGTVGGSESGTVGGSESGTESGGQVTSTSEPPPVDSESDTGASESDTGVSESDTNDIPDPPIECLIDSQDESVFVMVGTDSIDEVCSVVTSMMAGDQLSLSFDCPEAGARSVVFASGPLPGVIPQVGDLLGVYYQPGDFDGTLFDLANPELLFLRSEESLVYASIRGYFIRDEDRAKVQEKAQPLGVELVEGICPGQATGWEPPGDGPSCELQAVAQIQLTGDAETVVLEGETTTVVAGSDSFAVDLRVARRGSLCVEDQQIDYLTLAIARE